MASVARSRLLLILAITSLAVSAPAVAFAECMGDSGGGGGGSYEWPEEPVGGGGGTEGGGSTGGGGGTTEETRCSSWGGKNEGLEEDCRAWEGQIAPWESWESPASSESLENALKEEQKGHNPILFVHGIFGNSGSMKTMVTRFEKAGWAPSRLLNWSYNYTQSNAVIASEIASKVTALRNRTKAAKVDIIAHSMGALSSRYYLKFLGGTNYVQDFVSLGGPNHGTKRAFWCKAVYLYPATPCQQMYPGSDFLNRLNEGDETPGSVNYLAYRSSCDVFIYPSSSAYLIGAQNLPTSDPNAATTPCPGHRQMHENETVFWDVMYFVLY